jgi:NADH-quinone oxidoreductase subunit J
MSASTVIFYILAALVLTFGVLTVTSRHIFRAAIYLLFALIGVAGIYVLLEMDFVAALQIIIYVGGIVVLIIFSIFLTHQSGLKLMDQSLKKAIIGGTIALSGFALAISLIAGHTFTKTTEAALEPTVQNIGRQMLSYKEHGYAFPFEVISVLLLAALVGSIVIAIKTRSIENK